MFNHSENLQRLNNRLSNNHLYYALPVEMLRPDVKPLLIETIMRFDFRYYTPQNQMGQTNQLLWVVIDINTTHGQDSLMAFNALINAIEHDETVAIHSYNVQNAKAVQQLLRHLYNGMWMVKKQAFPQLLQFEYIGHFDFSAPKLSKQDWLAYVLVQGTLDTTANLSFLSRLEIQALVGNSLYKYLNNSAQWATNSPQDLVSIKIEWSLVMMYIKDFATMAMFLDRLPL